MAKVPFQKLLNAVGLGSTDEAAAALKGGNSGAVLTPGDPLRSRLFQAIAGLDPDLKMPPNGATEEVPALWVPPLRRVMGLQRQEAITRP